MISTTMHRDGSCAVGTDDATAAPADHCETRRINEPKAYYIQDTRSYVGHSALWWGPIGKGYTTDLREAGIYTEQEALDIERNRETDRKVPVEIARQAATLHVPGWRLRKAEANAGCEPGASDLVEEPSVAGDGGARG